MTEEALGVAGLFRKWLEDPKSHEEDAVIRASLWMVQRELFEELQDLGIPVSVLTLGFEDPAYREWATVPGRNRATHERSFHAIFFGQQLAKAQAALTEGDYRGALYSLCTFVVPPFRVQDKPGGRKAKVTPRLAAFMQASAEALWRTNPRLSTSRVADRLAPLWAKIFDAYRWGDPPAARTIRGKIRKPGWAK